MYDVPSAGNSSTPRGPSGMRAFTIVWLGQLVSLVGSAMTFFALTFWAWEQSGAATALALMGLFGFAPSLFVSPIAGALVDRWNRKMVMMLSDLAAGVSSILTLLLYSLDSLQLWHLYILAAFASVFQSFQWPAYSAAISTMLPKKHYARANGMISMAESGSGILAPVIAGILLAAFGGNIVPILWIDIVTFSAAIGTLLFVHIPQPKQSAAGAEGKGSLWKESGFGFRYILARPSLLGLQLVFFAINFFGSFQFTLVNPMILARTASNVETMGVVQSAFGVGGVLGGLLLTIWGGPQKKVHGVLLGMVGTSFFGGVLLGVGQTVWIWAFASFMTMLIMPILNGSNQAIWQAKVPPDIQGRVFSVRRLIAQISSPLAMVIVGPLADYLLEPAMQPQGALSSSLGGLFGVGPGTGMGVIMAATGVLGMLVGFGGYMFSAVRNAEELIPDHAETGEADEQSDSEAAAQVGDLQPALD